MRSRAELDRSLNLSEIQNLTWKSESWVQRWILIGVQSNYWLRCSPDHPHFQWTACAVLILGSRSTQTNCIQIKVDQESRYGHVPASCTTHFSTPHSIRSRKLGQRVNSSISSVITLPLRPNLVSFKKRDTTGNIYIVLPRNILPQLFTFFFGPNGSTIFFCCCFILF